MKYNKFKYYFLIFMIGAFVGWIYEEIFCFFEDGFFVNKGFLYGCYLPIYGYGSIVLITLLKRFKKNPIIIFIASLLLTGIVEYIGGAIMENVFKMELWNYDGLLLNINGYVCLRSVLTFAIGGLLLIYLIEPFVEKITIKKNIKLVNIITIIILIIFIVDNIITFAFRY